MEFYAKIKVKPSNFDEFSARNLPYSLFIATLISKINKTIN